MQNRYTEPSDTELWREPFEIEKNMSVGNIYYIYCLGPDLKYASVLANTHAYWLENLASGILKIYLRNAGRQSELPGGPVRRGYIPATRHINGGHSVLVSKVIERSL